MTNRQTAILVTVAVVAGATLAGVGLATRGSPKPRHVLQIDEVKGSVGRIVLGETATNVLGVLGRPREVGYAPGDVLVYARLQVGLKQDRVVSIETDDAGAQTDRILRIGDPLSAARALYRKASHCVPNATDKTAPHPHCRITVPVGALLIAGDPIRTIALVR